MTADRVLQKLTAITVSGVEKRYRPTKHYVYIIGVLWSDGLHTVIYRAYRDFYDFQIRLLDTFPQDAGENDVAERIIPYLPGRQLFKSETLKIATERLVELSSYCDALVGLPVRLSQHDHVIKFFEPTRTDLVPPADVCTKPEKSGLFKALALLPAKVKKVKIRASHIGSTTSLTSLDAEPEVAYVSAPIELLSYRALAAFTAQDKQEISFTEGDTVDVIKKNDTGWWLVQVDDKQGWAPASLLEPGGQRVEQEPEPLFNYEQFLALEDYTALLDDELTFRKGATLDVMHKLLDGYWVANYNGRVGYVPATYLTPTSRTSHHAAPVVTQDLTRRAVGSARPPSESGTWRPAQRRCTIKPPGGVTGRRRRGRQGDDLSDYQTMSTRMNRRRQALLEADRQRGRQGLATCAKDYQNGEMIENMKALSATQRTPPAPPSEPKGKQPAASRTDSLPDVIEDDVVYENIDEDKIDMSAKSYASLEEDAIYANDEAFRCQDDSPAGEEDDCEYEYYEGVEYYNIAEPSGGARPPHLVSLRQQAPPSGGRVGSYDLAGSDEPRAATPPPEHPASSDTNRKEDVRPAYVTMTSFTTAEDTGLAADTVAPPVAKPRTQRRGSQSEQKGARGGGGTPAASALPPGPNPTPTSAGGDKGGDKALAKGDARPAPRPRPPPPASATPTHRAPPATPPAQATPTHRAPPATPPAPATPTQRAPPATPSAAPPGAGDSSKVTPRPPNALAARIAQFES